MKPVTMNRIGRIRRIVFWLALSISVTLNGLQGMRILKIEDELSVKGPLAEGDRVPNLVGKDLVGKDQTIAFGGSPLPTLLYVFSPSCVWCERNAGSINSLAEKLAGTKARVVGVSLASEGLQEFVDRHHIAFPVLTEIPSSLGEAYKLGPTPETIIVSPQGKVVMNWTGAFSGPAGPLIEKFFSLRIGSQM
jgi:peroxiredoxin